MPKSSRLVITTLAAKTDALSLTVHREHDRNNVHAVYLCSVLTDVYMYPPAPTTISWPYEATKLLMATRLPYRIPLMSSAASLSEADVEPDWALAEAEADIETDTDVELSCETMANGLVLLTAADE